ncbi:uncharacterized protein LOC124910634 [Impatiens glandulifera]|uniref:uncharacterized protein LOC124910634 n=1 Tax=Impatiens glandulifera TaxID=253017 RepID=UPI001FB07B19|nr:uncharacterized protein LOC124910634 [Impatiens glandulifera]
MMDAAFSTTMTMMKVNSPRIRSIDSLIPVSSGGRLLQIVRCTPFRLVLPQMEAGIACEPCKGTGWLLCEFCEGKKTNVKSATNRIYRRCPTCRAMGYVLCSNCKVFKCVAFPNYEDGEEVVF